MPHLTRHNIGHLGGGVVREHSLQILPVKH